MLALYAEADRLLAGWTCDASSGGCAPLRDPLGKAQRVPPDCCRFAVTGREPQLWPNEWRELERAIAARGVPVRKLRVVEDDSETCPLLDRGRCTVYAARPFGCRTFFCDRAAGPERRPPRAELAEIGRRIGAAAREEDPRCDGPRRITAWLRR